MTNPEMTLRDWFAGQALTSGSDGLTIEEAAERAYRIADAMLVAREPQPASAQEEWNPVCRAGGAHYFAMRQTTAGPQVYCVMCNKAPPAPGEGTTGHTLGDFQL